MDAVPEHNNYAFIDGHNVFLNASKSGGELDCLLFREYLRKEHEVKKAFVFLGFVLGNESSYKRWEDAGFLVIFKDAVRRKDGTIKGNCDVDLTLRLCMEINNFHMAILVTGDGDFECVAEVLIALGKLRAIIAIDIKSCSYLYQVYFSKYLMYLSGIRGIASKNAGS